MTSPPDQPPEEPVWEKKKLKMANEHHEMHVLEHQHGGDFTEFEERNCRDSEKLSSDGSRSHTFASRTKIGKDGRICTFQIFFSTFAKAFPPLMDTGSNFI